MKNNKNDDYIYDALELINMKDLDQVYVEEEISGVQSESEIIKSKTLEKLKLKNNIKKKSQFKWKKVLVAALIIMFASGIFIGNQISNASKIYNNTSIEAYGMDVNKEAVEKYSTKINKVATDKDISIKVKSVLLDGKTIWIDYDIYSSKFNFNKEKWPEEMESSEVKIKVNEKEGQKGSGSAYVSDKNTISYTKALSTEGANVKGDVNIEVYTNQIGTKKGNWNVSFTASLKNIDSETKEYKIGRIFVENKSIYRINSIVINPIETTIYYSSFGKNNSMLSLDVLNEDKQSLIATGGGESGKFFMKSGEIKYSSSNIKGDTLTLIVYKNKTKESGEESKTDKIKEIEININK